MDRLSSRIREGSDMTQDTKAMEAARLEPCPFCGGGNVTTFSSLFGEANTDAPLRTVWTAFCAACEGGGPHKDTAAGAIAAWKRRPAAPALPSEEVVESARGIVKLDRFYPAGVIKVARFVLSMVASHDQ